MRDDTVLDTESVTTDLKGGVDLAVYVLAAELEKLVDIFEVL